MKNFIKIGICLLLAVLFMSFQAIEAKAYNDHSINYNLTDNWKGKVHLFEFLDNNLASFNTYDGSQLSGSYEATFIGYRAAHTNLFYDTNSYDQNDTSTFFATGKSHPASASDAGDSLTISTDTTKFIDTNVSLTANLGSTDGYLQYYQLTSDWTYTGKSGITLNFLENDIIVGFNDNSKHIDHMDLVVALRPSPVPVPGAIWLLGSGLLGLVGIRRRNS